jgi:hypothetical protein
MDGAANHLTWKTVPGRVYSVWASDSLPEGFRKLVGGVVAVGSTASFTDTEVSGADRRTYAIRVSEQ